MRVETDTPLSILNGITFALKIAKNVLITIARK